MDLFSHSSESLVERPLAEKVRPKTFGEFFGQEKYVNAQSTLLKTLRATGFLPNLILWGPPGSGKTTFALLLSAEVKARFIHASAIDTGAKDLRAIGVESQDRRRVYNEKTLLFIDEIHRLNKAQQDVLLPFTERGDLTLVGATTENPSYELNSALLSRCRVLKFEVLSEGSLFKVLRQACEKINLQWRDIFTEESCKSFIRTCHGDARQLLNRLEIIINAHVGRTSPFSLDELKDLHLVNPLPFDKLGEQHYDTISAFIKSVRGSDADAAIYYLARMLEAGEDPVFVARRLVILASEDIGNAEPQGLVLAISALQAVELIGMPEARITLAQVTSYLACAPKCNRAYVAIDKAIAYVRETGALPVPLHLRSSQTSMSKNLGYGQGYVYSHDDLENKAGQTFLPDKAKDQKFY